MSTDLQQELEDAAATVEVPIGDLDAVLQRAQQRVGRRRRVATTVVAFCVLGVSAAGMSLGDRGTSSTPAADQPGPTPVSAPFDARHPTRAGLLDLYDDPRPDFPTVDRVEVKKTTWGDVRAVLKRVYNEEQPESVAPDAEIVYVFVQAGVHVPSRGRVAQEPFSWGAMVFATDGGRPLTSFAYRDGQDWPLFFGQLEDRGGD